MWEKLLMSRGSPQPPPPMAEQGWALDNGDWDMLHVSLPNPEAASLRQSPGRTGEPNGRRTKHPQLGDGSPSAPLATKSSRSCLLSPCPSQRQWLPGSAASCHPGSVPGPPAGPRGIPWAESSRRARMPAGGSPAPQRGSCCGYSGVRGTPAPAPQSSASPQPGIPLPLQGEDRAPGPLLPPLCPFSLTSWHHHPHSHSHHHTQGLSWPHSRGAAGRQFRSPWSHRRGAGWLRWGFQPQLPSSRLTEWLLASCPPPWPPASDLWLPAPPHITAGSIPAKTAWDGKRPPHPPSAPPNQRPEAQREAGREFNAKSLLQAELHRAKSNSEEGEVHSKGKVCVRGHGADRSASPPERKVWSKKKRFWSFQLCPGKWFGVEATRVQERMSILAIQHAPGEAKDTMRK